MTIADTLRHLGLASPDPRSDGELLTRFVSAREEAAFAELLLRHGPTEYADCRRVLANAPDADDAFQAVFLVLARKANTVRPPGMVGNWLYGVAVRTANKARVMNAKRRARDERAATAREREIPNPLPGGRGSSDELAVIDAELAALPDVYRAAFVTCELNGRSRSEASRELGWPEGTVAARLAKARELLAARLTKRGVTLGVGLFAAAVVPTATATDAMSAVRELLAVGTASAVSPAAQTLCNEVTKSMTTTHTKWLLLGGLVLALATGGAVLMAGPGDRPVREQIKAPVPKELVSDWKTAEPIELDGKRITSVAYNPDGTKIAIGQENLTTLIDALTRKTLWFHEGSGPDTRVAFSPDGETVAATFQDGVRLLNTTTGKLIFTLEGKGSAPTAVAFFPDRPTPAKELQLHQIAFGHPGKLILKTGVTWDKASTITSSLTPKGIAPEGVTALPLAVSPTGDGRVVTLGPTDRKTGRSILWAWGAGGGAESKELIGQKARPVAAAWSKQGHRIVTADEGGTLIVWDAEEFKEKSRVELGEGVVQLALAPDGKTLAAVRAFVDTTLFGRSGRTLFNIELHVFDITDPPAKPKPLWTVRNQLSDAKTFGGPVSLAFAPDGKTLLAAFADPYIPPQQPGDVPGTGSIPKSMGVKVWELVAKK